MSPAVWLVGFGFRPTVTERDGECVDHWLPTHRPSGAACPGRVQASSHRRYRRGCVGPGAVSRCDGRSDTGEWISDAEVAECAYTAFVGTARGVAARLVVRRVKDKNHQHGLFAVWRYHASWPTRHCPPWMLTSSTGSTRSSRRPDCAPARPARSETKPALLGTGTDGQREPQLHRPVNKADHATDHVPHRETKITDRGKLRRYGAHGARQLHTCWAGVRTRSACVTASASSTGLSWEKCVNDVGERVRWYDRCLAHVTDDERAAYLARLGSSQPGAG